MQYNIARCPFRINFAGGSTDYKSYYSKYGGLIVSATIQHYAYACVKSKSPFSEYDYYLQYSQIEQVSNRHEIQHNGIRGTLEYLEKYVNWYSSGLEIVHLSDLPSQTGIGSSSAFITALFVSITRNNYDKTALSTVAAHIEREILKEPGGISDGISSTYGGLNTIDIAEDGTYKVRPLPVSNEFLNELQSRIFLVYTGGPKNSYEIAASHDTIEAEKRKQYIHKLANDMKYAFYAESIDDIARLLEEGWKAKRFLSSSISDVSIDNLCESLHSWGAMGCRLIGSGGNGFVMTIVDNPNDFVAKLQTNNVRYTGVSFDYDGAKLLKTGD